MEGERKKSGKWGWMGKTGGLHGQRQRWLGDGWGRAKRERCDSGGVRKRGAYCMFLTAEVFHCETSPLNADANMNIHLRVGTSGVGWGLQDATVLGCNNSRERANSAGEEQDEGERSRSQASGLSTRKEGTSWS